jgi:outer membrane lipoprotein-sorting protein
MVFPLKIKVLLLGGLALLSSCGGLLQKGETEVLTPRQALLLQIERQNQIKSFTGTATISIESPEQAQTFTADILVSGDSLKLAIEYFLGASAAELLVTGERFLFLHLLNDNFLAGHTDDFYGQAFFQLPVPLSAFSSLLLGKSPLDTSFASYQVTDLNQQYIFETVRDGKVWFYYIDKYQATLHKIEVYSLARKQLLVLEFERFRSRAGMLFPEALRLIRKDKVQYLSVSYQTFTLNETIPGDKFSIVIPETSNQLDL